jgi:hypothetical protein
MTRRKHASPGPQGGRRTVEAVAATGPRVVKLPQVWVSEDEKARVLELAAEHGVSLAEWIRRRATTTGAVR